MNFLKIKFLSIDKTFSVLLNFIFLFTSSLLLAQTNYYVAKNGSNSNSGTSISSPFLTISHAVSQINAGDKIYIRRGTYHEEIIIDNIDSTSGNETLISNYNNEQVIIDGTIAINGSWIDDTIGGVAVKKIENFSESISQLFVGNDQMVMARWPNAQFDDLSIYDHDNWAQGEETGSTDGSFLIDESYDDPGSLSLANSIGILNVGSFRTFNREIATHTQQGGDDIITYTTPIGENGLGAGLSNNGELKDKHHYFFFEGKKEFIDVENEWFLDTTNDDLYLNPPNGVDLFQTPIRGKIRDYSMTIAGSEFLKINGLTFFATTIHARGSNNLEISACNFYYASHSKRMLGDLSGAHATTFGTGSGNTARVDSSTVSGCLFIDTEGEALVIRGNNNTIKNSYFRNIDWSATELNGLMVSVFIDGTANTFTGNEIYHTGASATVWPGEQSIFSYNIVSSTGHAQSDGSVFQGTKNYVFGSEVHHNFVYDTEKYAFRYDAPGGDAAQAGSFGVMHHNIADNTLGLMIKGNNQIIAHNTVINTISNRNDIIILAEDCSNTNTWLYNNLAERIGSHRSDVLFSAPSNGPMPIGTEGYIENGDDWEVCDSNDGALYSGTGTGSSTGNMDSINVSRPGIGYNSNIENLIDYNPGNGKTISDYQPISNEIIDQGVSLTNIVSTSLTGSNQLNSIVPHTPVGSGTDIGAIDGNSLWTPGVQGWTPQQNINLEDIFYNPGIVESNLLLHFDFANSTSYPGSGNQVYDLSNNYNQGDLNGNPSMVNNHGGVVDLDGTNDYIQLNDPFSYQEHSVEMWIKMKESGSAFLWDARDSNDDGYILFYNSAYKYFIQTTDLENSQSHLNQWVQVVASYNGEKSRIFINGQKVEQSNSITNNSVINNNTNARVGVRNFDPLAWFSEAEIGIVRFYNQTLYSADVLQNYNANAARYGLTSNPASPTSIDITQPIPTRGLKLYLDSTKSDSYQSGSNTWHDLSGNDYDFTVSGNPPFDSSKKGGVINFQAGGDYATNNSDPILNVNSYSKFAVFQPLAATANNIISGGNSSKHAFFMNSSPHHFRAGHNTDWDKVKANPNGGASILNIWNLGTVTFDTDLGMDLYYSGNLVDSNSSATVAVDQTSPLVNIARYNTGNYFTGYIPVAIIYDRKLSNHEVNSLSNHFASRYGLSHSNTSSLTIDEGVPINTILADLDVTDPDSTQFIYELVSGNGGIDQHNSSFTISGTQIVVGQIISFDNTPLMNINLKVTDESNNSLTQSLIIYVNDLNRAPTDLGISSTTFLESVSASSTIATLSAVDSDTSDTHVFTLINGNGSNDADNSSFTISGTSLIINSTADYETKTSYDIYINVNDGVNDFAKAFTVSVTNINEAPSDLGFSSLNLNLEYLIVAGGGGGGYRHGAGGGAGGLLSGSLSLYTSKTLDLIVGQGGAEGNGTTFYGSNGDNSELSSDGITTLTAIGGGGARAYDTPSGMGAEPGTGSNGGSGSGASYRNGLNISGGSGTPGQGHNGGNIISSSNQYNHAGGGGAGGPGEDGTSTRRGDGGIGIQSSITGTAKYYAGGGGGGSHKPSPSSGGGAGGLGGGGAGGTAGQNSPGVSGTPNSGGGGGGASTFTGGNSSGGSGGSGIVILRYLGTPNATGGTITQSGGYTTHSFTNVGTNNFTITGTTTTTASVDEGSAVGSVVAALVATDSDTTNLTFSLVLGNGTNDQHNSLFTVSGTLLTVAGNIDYETNSTLNIYVQVSDGENIYQKAMIVNVNDVKETPSIQVSDVVKTFGGVNFDLTATSSSTGAFTYTVADQNVAIINGNTVTIVGAGSSSITVTQAEDNYFTSATATFSLIINKADVIILIDDIIKNYRDNDFNLSAISSSTFVLTSDFITLSPPTNTNPTYWYVSSVWENKSFYENAPPGYGNNKYYTPWLDSPQSWTAKFNNTSQWITLDLQVQSMVYQVITKARTISNNNYNQYVKKANILYGIDNTNWTTIFNNTSLNTSSNDNPVSKIFTSPVPARYVKVEPTEWNNNISMRMGVVFRTINQSLSSNGSLTFSSSNNNVVSTSSSSATINGAGSVNVTVSQAETSNYNSSTSSFTITVNKIDPTIIFDDLTKTYEDADFNLIATSSSTGAFTFNILDTNVATVAGSSTTIVGAGTTTVSVTQAADSNYNAATATMTLSVNKADHTITFDDLTKTYEDPDFNLVATSSSTGAFTFNIMDANVASVTGSITTLVGAGTTTVTVTQAADSNYNAATATMTLTVNKADPSIIFNDVIATYGQVDFDLTSTSSSTGALTYNILDANVATLSDKTVTVVGAGSTTVTLNQSADSNYNAATATMTLTVNKVYPLITFGDVTKIYGNADFFLTATSSSTGAFTYNIIDANVATVNVSRTTIVGAGSTLVTVSQAENSNYNAATATMTLTVNESDPTVTFNNVNKKFTDPDFNLTATSSSSGVFTYNILDNNIATVSGNTVTIIGAGTTSVTVSQSADSNYNAATATMTLTVNKADPGIGNFNNINKTYGDSDFEIIEPSKNNLNNSNFIYSSSDSNIASISGNTISIKQAGSVVINASLPSDNNFNASVVSATLNINKASQLISIGSLPTTLPLKDFNSISLTASSTSGTPISIILANGSAASLNGGPGNYNLESIQQTGLVTITYYVDENSSVNYSAATVTLVVDVVKVNQNISFNSSPTSNFEYSENLSIPIDASASSSLTLSYNLISGNASLNSNTISVNGTGQIIVELSQIGNNQFNAAPPLNYSVNIGQGTTLLSGFSVPSKYEDDIPFQVTPPTSNRLGEIVYSSSNLQVATISGTVIRILNDGQTIITANQIANNNYRSGTISTVFIVNEAIIPDIDNDGVDDENDNCITNFNPLQEDYDNDNIGDICDNDDDNDGYLDSNDEFPLNPNEWSDYDKDGLGDNQDNDDDNDNWPDSKEISCNTNPLDNSSYPADYDGDLIPNCEDQDDDNDGYPDDQDEFPENELEWKDNDQDGIGDNEDQDDDQDGYTDNDESSCNSDPLDPDSTPDDFDQDFIPNCTDLDDDNDGCLDNEDTFPLDYYECLDSDNDGTGDNADNDDDNDGVSDSQDEFPFDPTEQKDTDGDGIGDNSDTDYNSDGLPDDVVFPSQFFSPNGDGINDTWKVVNTNLFPNCEVWIYTRSGELIYNKKGYTNDWTGLLNGEPLPEASYVYMVDPDGDGTIDLKGWIYLTR